MLQKLMLLCFLTASVQLCNAQVFESRLIDDQNQEGVSGALIFISNSSQSTTSDKDGYFSIDRSSLPNSDVVISHIAYETKYLNLQSLKNAKDTIFLSLIDHTIEEVVLKTKKSNKRKKWLKRFTNSLVGNTANAKKIKLINPEVVLFKEVDKTLKVETSGNLIFENDATAYKMTFVLEDYALEKNDNVYYSGKVLFENYETLEDHHQMNRNEVYRRSSRKFFKDLVSDHFDSLQYLISLATMEGDGFFHYVGEMQRKNILKENEHDDYYKLLARKYIRIENTAVVDEVSEKKINPGFGGATSLRFILDRRNGKSGSETDFAVSYFGSTSDMIIIDSNGIIINQKDIIEYGYWSNMRLADMLPDDFKYLQLGQ